MSTLGNRQQKRIGIWLRNTVLSLLAIAAFGLVYVFQIEPNWFEVVPVNITIPKLSPAFDNFKIVQISDLHVDTSMNQQKLDKIVELIQQQQPDAIAMTGDFVTVLPREKTIKLLENTFKQLSATTKTLAVLGNHDHWDWSNPDLIRKLLRDNNVEDISNSFYTLEKDRAKLIVAGVDDFWAKQADLDAVLSQLVDDTPAILLAHEPDFADLSAPTHRFALQMSGHSHGGQVKLPFLQPIVLPPFAHKYPLGRYQVEEMIQYTNRGVGMISPAVRFNCRPEITVFTLHPA